MNHIVLFHPEIPQNTGNIMRTAMATESILHIIGPLPFQLNDQSVKRAGLDYSEHLTFQYYESYEAFMVKNKSPKLYCLTRYGNQIYTEMNVSKTLDNHYFMFGSETSGIEPRILQQHQHSLFRIPMSVLARSLNLSNTVALVIYEALRQQHFSGLATKEVLKGPGSISSKLNQ